MSSKQDEHWTKTKSLTTTTLVIWAIISFVIHWFGEGLNSDAFPELISWRAWAHK